ncbi:Cpsf3l [Symbiodinium sp. CCMP2592]|nr:Cpsf3l [Symbiodinium sp. CCMP2592]
MNENEAAFIEDGITPLVDDDPLFAPLHSDPDEPAELQARMSATAKEGRQGVLESAAPMPLAAPPPARRRRRHGKEARKRHKQKQKAAARAKAKAKAQAAQAVAKAAAAKAAASSKGGSSSDSSSSSSSRSEERVRLRHRLAAEKATSEVLRRQLQAREEDVKSRGRQCDQLAMAQAAAVIETLTKQRQNDMARDLNKALAEIRKRRAGK